MIGTSVGLIAFVIVTQFLVALAIAAWAYVSYRRMSPRTQEESVVKAEKYEKVKTSFRNVKVKFGRMNPFTWFKRLSKRTKNIIYSVIAFVAAVYLMATNGVQMVWYILANAAPSFLGISFISAALIHNAFVVLLVMSVVAVFLTVFFTKKWMSDRKTNLITFQQ